MINAEFTNEINDLITENLYQWDTYQTLRISGIDFGSVAPRVHFANKKSTEALVVDGAMQGDGSVEVSIPNSLLTQKYDILAYVYINTGLTSKTIKSITIPIISRLKPSEYYQPTDEDIAQIEAIELEAKAIISGLTASEYNSTTTYKRPNIVYYNYSAYMCKSSVEITGIVPTNTSKWQKICNGVRITGIAISDNGNLTFTSTDGSYEIDFSTAEVDTADGLDVPALDLTYKDVLRVKNMIPTVNSIKFTNGVITDVPTVIDDGVYIFNVPISYNNTLTLTLLIDSKHTDAHEYESGKWKKGFKSSSTYLSLYGHVYLECEINVDADGNYRYASMYLKYVDSNNELNTLTRATTATYIRIPITDENVENDPLTQVNELLRGDY